MIGEISIVFFYLLLEFKVTDNRTLSHPTDNIKATALAYMDKRGFWLLNFANI